jgi:MFS family permease
VLVALVVGWCGFAVQGVLVAPVVPLFQSQYDVPADAASFVLTSALLVAALATPVMSRLGDRYGKKRLMVVAMAMLAGGGLIAALAPTFGLLIVGRSLQGASAVMFPLGVSLIRDLFPPDAVRRASSVLGASISIAGGAGLVLAGILVGDGDQLAPLLWFSAAYGVLALVVVATIVPESDYRTRAGLDLPGATLLSVGLVCLLLPLSQGGSWGWTSPATLGLLAATVVLLTGWVLVELRAEHPMVDVRLLVGPAVLSTSAASFAYGFAQLIGFVGLVQLVQVDSAQHGYGFSASVLAAGFYVLPTTTLQFFMAFVAARLVQRWAGQRLITVGYLVGAVGLAALTAAHGAGWQVVAFSCLYGAGLGLAFALIPPRLVDTVPHAQMTSASAINAIVFNVGQVIGGAVLGAVVAAATDAGASVPREVAYTVGFAVASVASLLGAVVFALLAGAAARDAGSLPVVDVGVAETPA